MSIQKKIGRAIQKSRKEQGLSQDDLAGLVQMDRSYLSEIENGKKNLSMILFCHIAAALGIKPDELLKRAKI